MQADDSLIWFGWIAEPQEILPWIHGWGADWEVISPLWPRKKLEKEIQKIASLYGLNGAIVPQTQFFARKKDGEEREDWQPLIEHLQNSADMARRFGEFAGVGDLAYIAGLVHDLGKYSIEFQKRLEGGHKVDHSTAGAKELMALLKNTPQEAFAGLLAYPITGHHTGLLDYGDETDVSGDGTLAARLKTQVCDYSVYKGELNLSHLSFPPRLHIRPLILRLKSGQDKMSFGFSASMLTRMVYSALVDADFQETQTYMQGVKSRGQHESISALRDKLNIYLKKFENPTSEINRRRSETLHACNDKATEKPGFFRLTVPTGGGKTLASMSFALNHAVEHGLRRVIYVIPYTTIIEQNAGVFKEILGEENVLEHHANFDWEQKKRETNEKADDQTNSIYAKLKLAAENWDVPIVVTTNVQFFESLFANKSSRCRKLHNIAQSVIVFDEAQMLPRDYLLPAMSAVWELVVNYGASAVFCTATQPGLERFLPPNTPITDLVDQPQELFDFYKRVHVKNLEKQTDESLLARLNGHEQVLCIVNTRRHASALFGGLQGEGNYHLSTLMCPVHRKEKLVEIRDRLENNLPCRVISTTIMEAGIDVDFPVGYRAISGLDSINQAAGRVNRNMRHPISMLFIFEPDSEYAKFTPAYITQAISLTRRVLRQYPEAPISIPAVDSYFNQLYDLQDWSVFDAKGIIACFDDNNLRFKFQTAAQKFQIIEDTTVPVIIPYNEEAKNQIEELKFTDYPDATLRKLQPYTVSIYEREFNALNNIGAISQVAEKFAVLNDKLFVQDYHPETGLIIPE